MKNLNAEQIIKALECCTDERSRCTDCPRFGFTPCTKPLMKDALALIKELTEEVASWKEIAEHYQKQFGYCYEDKVKLIAEKERLRAEYEKAHIFNESYEYGKTDTVRKMQERLKAETITIQDHTGKLGLFVLVGTVDQIAKEMLEEK